MFGAARGRGGDVGVGTPRDGAEGRLRGGGGGGVEGGSRGDERLGFARAAAPRPSRLELVVSSFGDVVPGDVVPGTSIFGTSEAARADESGGGREDDALGVVRPRRARDVRVERDAVEEDPSRGVVRGVDEIVSVMEEEVGVVPGGRRRRCVVGGGRVQAELVARADGEESAVRVAGRPRREGHGAGAVARGAEDVRRGRGDSRANLGDDDGVAGGVGDVRGWAGRRRDVRLVAGVKEHAHPARGTPGHALSRLQRRRVRGRHREGEMGGGPLVDPQPPRLCAPERALGVQKGDTGVFGSWSSKTRVGPAAGEWSLLPDRPAASPSLSGRARF